MKKLILITTILATNIFVSAQKETDHWFFGTSAGMNFTSGTPIQESGAVFGMNEGSASISTSTGSLMFYTDGVQIWNSNHNVMPNGTGLLGNVSSTQSAIIVPNPANNDQYYVFCVAADGDTAGFTYSIVDMTLNGGLGDVTTTKNVFVEDSCTEKLCAIKTNTGSYWIMTHKWGNDAFYAYQLTGLGLQPPIISHVGTVHNTSTFQNTYGQMKFNNCGTKLAVAIGYQNMVEYFDFNLNTGVVSNAVQLPQFDHVYGVEFSPNSNLLYCTSYDGSGTLLQYNISLSTLALVLASRTPLTVTPDIYGLQLASDGKIYAAKSFTSSYVGVIQSPDTQGSGCNYIDNGVNIDSAFMGNSCGLGLPGFMQTYLKVALNISCNTSGTEDQILNAVDVYPNPSANHFLLQLEGEQEVEITILNQMGQVVHKQVCNEGYNLFGHDLVPGVYYANLRYHGHFKTIKLIKL